MKKKAILIAALIALIVLLTGCDGTIQSGNRIMRGKDVQTFTYAYIALGGEHLVEGYITQWRDYENSDVVQVLLDGKYYLTHYTNVVMIADPSQGALGYGNPNLWGKEE